MSHSQWYLALDVGGTNIKAGLVDEAGRVLARRRFSTGSGRPVPEVIGDMAANLRELIAEIPDGRRPEALAVGMPGWLNQAEGFLIQAPNMPGWINVPVTELLSRALGLPVFLENDTNLYALGEWAYGAGRGLTNFMAITLGTGVGGGLILDGRLWNGSFASAAEIGHIPVDLNGALCGCGRLGCLETVSSATGMSRLGREWLKAGRPTAYTGRPEDLHPDVMHGLARQGDPMALAVFHEAGRALGQVLSGVFNLLGLEGVAIGGGAAGALEFIRPSLWEVLAERLIVTTPDRIQVLKGQLGDDAPLAGAAALLRRLAAEGAVRSGTNG